MDGARTALTFLGGAGTVTGSAFLMEHDGRRLLVDCGLYQGERRWRRLNWEPFAVPPASIDAVVVTHAHLDHCGYLPDLVRDGLTGPIWGTRWSNALAAIVLRDSGRLHERDARDARASGYSRHDPPLPLYTAEQAEQAIAHFRAASYGELVPIGDAIDFTLSPAGHVLGSASVLVRAGGSRVQFSGDLGRPWHPILPPRASPPDAKTVVIESTYGDRSHHVAGPAHHAMAAAISRTVRRGGSVLIAAFAIDRTVLVLEALSALVRAGDIPEVPVIVDSPMALAALDVYRDAAEHGQLQTGIGADLVDLPTLRLAPTPDESMALNRPGSPSIVLSASGMASGGRIVHHLRSWLPDRDNSVILTGFQAPGTRGRELVDGARDVKLLGRYVPVRAEVVHDEEFSVHADADELVEWLGQMHQSPAAVYVVHGEQRASIALADRIRDRVGCAVSVPERGEKVLVDDTDVPTGSASPAVRSSSRRAR
ncbi:MBL fold metallo-hydrolase RNA specificity domain-containing protein [Cellulomonas humilata]|uniref:Metallo-beta-lactamase family protein n=1 Tax=Cellulomonas humilata TaxID=144055 RepID=A0ABU0EHM5_9CELL|nr:MBL fold metallo-hydrolase [Cellulomonas humilata]MDQ0374717.1 metallo-beta-lactamase family protein [Cellulomonas humilata]